MHYLNTNTSLIEHGTCMYFVCTLAVKGYIRKLHHLYIVEIYCLYTAHLIDTIKITLTDISALLKVNVQEI